MCSLPLKPLDAPVQLAGVADLTVLTPMRRGLIPGVWDTLTWSERLARVLALLDALRRLGREASPAESPFFDLVGRWQIVHFFRFAAVPAERSGGVPQILLNVTFDGVWEPYMRVIWGPLGPLLDLIFCHAQSYRLAHEVGFDDYMAWVRANEVRPGFFYADGGLGAGDRTLTVADRSWMAQADAVRGAAPDAAAADRHAAALSLPIPPAPRDLLVLAPAGQAPAPELIRALATGLRVLRAFGLLRPNFDATPGSTVLLRAAQALLEEFHGFVAGGGFQRHPALAAMAAPHADALAWFGQRPAEPPRPVRLPALPDPSLAVQAGVLRPHEGGHGLLLLARLPEGAAPPAAWRQRLTDYAGTWADATPGRAAVSWTIGFTPQGLHAHGLAATELDARFPLDYLQGMEARGPGMGDLGPNHPQQWQRPRRNWRPAVAGQPAGVDAGAAVSIGLHEVHVAILLRTVRGRREAEPAGGQALPRLVDAAAQIESLGLTILSAQPLRRQEKGRGATRRSVGHFDFADPLSQPQPGPDGVVVPAAAQWWSDAVPWGEVLVGHANERRGDEAWPQAADALLDDGSYWVLRKLRQYVGRWNALDLGRDDRERLMGRRRSGAALLPTGAGGDNDFRYEAVPGQAGDPQGRRCPFAAHVRRANPRTDPLPGAAPEPERPPVPRLLRRGISYGPSWREQPSDDADRGLLFMAFNARIAEQFEAVQRWLAGGNASGVPSTHDDPICGVPRLGQERHVSWLDERGRVQRRSLGREPLVQLQWGLYLFVPSLAGLKALAALAPSTASTASTASGVSAASAPSEDSTAPGAGPMAAAPSSLLPAPDAPLEAWREALETGPVPRRLAVWREIRARGGVLATTHAGVLVGSSEAVQEVLRDTGGRFSVRGYGHRMAQTLGLGYLGQDAPDHGLLAPRINQALEAIPLVKAHRLGRGAAAQVLAAFPPDPASQGLVPVDLVGLVEAWMAGICSALFGLPDGAAMAAFPRYDPAQPNQARCPADQLQIARYVFLPHFEPPVQQLGRIAGARTLAAGRARVAAWRAGAAAPELAAGIGAVVDAALNGRPQAERDDAWARTLVGVLQGLPATVIGHTVKLLLAWATDARLWDVQRDLLALPAADLDAAHKVAELLRPRLLAQTRPDPVPDLIWRTSTVATRLAGVDVPADTPVVLSLRSAANDESAPLDAEARQALLFGRTPAGTAAAMHGCPGQTLAEGLMQGLLVAMAEAGSWQRSPSATLLWLRR
jgi:hypothetical protein